MSIGVDVPVGPWGPPSDLPDDALLESWMFLDPPPDDEPDAPLDALLDDEPVPRLTASATRRSVGLAHYLEDIHAVGECYAGGEFAAAEVGHALGWSEWMAGDWLRFADDVVVRLPMLHTALLEGRIDETKVRAFVGWTRSMPDDLARLVVDRLLGQAMELTTKTLIDAIGSTAAALDSDWADRRQRAAAARVRVEARLNAEGTADVATRDLHPAHAVPMMARLDALAAALVRSASAQGLRAPIHVVRALVSVRLQDGSCIGLDDEALIEELLVHLPVWLRDYGRHPTDPDDGPATDNGPTGNGPTDNGPTDDDGSDGPEEPSNEGNGGNNGGAGTDTDDDGFARLEHGVRAGTTELRLRLSTALGLDELPGQVPSWGTITAPTARFLLDDARAGDTPVEWRLVLTDADGHLEHVLLVRPGPAPAGPTPAGPQHGRPPGPRRPHRRGPEPARVRGRTIVELAAPTTMLAALDPVDHPDWALFLRRAHHRLRTVADGRRAGGAAHPATTRADARRRRPGRELDRYVRVRDRHCLGYLCTRPAYCDDLDHTRAWIDLGLTIAANLGALCRRCHRRKHQGRWRLHQPAPGRFRWDTRLGATYTLDPRPVLGPAPTPAPRPDGRPRPVLDVEGPLPDHASPWTDHRRPSTVAPSDVPDRPRAPTPAGSPTSPRSERRGPSAPEGRRRRSGSAPCRLPTLAG